MVVLSSAPLPPTSQTDADAAGVSSHGGGGGGNKRARLEGVLPKDPLVTDGTISFDSRREAFFSMGEGTHRVPMTMHADNRARLCAALRARAEISAEAVVVLQGGEEKSVYDTDTNWSFKQESNFQYLFGVKEPGCLAALRVRDARAVLLVPIMGEEYQAWCGPIKPPAWFQRAYGVDQVACVEEARSALEGLGAKELLFLQGDANRDSGLKLPEPDFEGKAAFQVSATGSRVLWDEMNECRLIKSEDELEILQYVNDVSSCAHIEVMRGARSGQREHLAEATFRYQSAVRGCFRTGYDCICGSGRRNAILHYGHPAEPNSELVVEGAMRLHDMGAEYHGYCADVTCSFPVSGRFDAAQRAVYGAVWAATLAVEQRVKPGVCYKDMHRLAQRTMLVKMKEAGLFVGEVEAMVAAGLMSFFMPHGLGHCLGLDVHDVGGYAPGAFRGDDASIKENLRLGRELKQGMVITVEPGFYFIDYLIQKLLDDPQLSSFVDEVRLRELWGPVGGVRIEDDVVITEDGCRVLTCVPREISEVEAVMAGQEWMVSSSCCRKYKAVSGKL
mmetsp:Transcript_128104/g.323417  ORF Transcript_128104/g.323417 Transcript_128104/m.323417 type:complete len:560 (-) Transcript_128104:111-1790(-)